jgi:hypothetical protein
MPAILKPSASLPAVLNPKRKAVSGMEWPAWNDAVASVVLYSSTAAMLLALGWRTATGRKVPRQRRASVPPLLGWPIVVSVLLLVYLALCAMRREKPRWRRRKGRAVSPPCRR